LVPGEGIEPSRVFSSPDFESGASTSSAIPARTAQLTRSSLKINQKCVFSDGYRAQGG
jgi:hypothetical protein